MPLHHAARVRQTPRRGFARQRTASLMQERERLRSPDVFQWLFFEQLFAMEQSPKRPFPRPDLALRPGQRHPTAGPLDARWRDPDLAARASSPPCSTVDRELVGPQGCQVQVLADHSPCLASCGHPMASCDEAVLPYPKSTVPTPARTPALHQSGLRTISHGDPSSYHHTHYSTPVSRGPLHHHILSQALSVGAPQCPTPPRHPIPCRPPSYPTTHTS